MIYVFLPAYNEEAALPILVRKFDREFKAKGQPYRIVVLDDGSSDNTATAACALAKEYPVEILRHEVNQGLGRTMVDGLEHVAKLSSPDDFIVTLDCDDTHDPKYMGAALEKIKEGFDVVILSRYQKGGGEKGLSFFRSFLSRAAGLFLKFFFPIKGIQEYSCGYRVFRASILKKAMEVFGNDFVRLSDLGFVVTPEILIKMRMLGARIAESPFVLRYDKKPTRSANKPIKTICGYLHLVWNYWGRSGVKRN